MNNEDLDQSVHQYNLIKICSDHILLKQESLNNLIRQSRCTGSSKPTLVKRHVHFVHGRVPPESCLEMLI